MTIEDRKKMGMEPWLTPEDKVAQLCRDIMLRTRA
jgi:hypothetical protein